MIRTALTALAATLLLAGQSASAETFKAGSETASAGTVRATLSWHAGTYGAKDPELRIERAGAVALDVENFFAECEEYCRFTREVKADLFVGDLSGDGEPEVAVTAFTGGAHCCTLLGLFQFDGTTYTRLTRNFGSYGYEIEDLDHDGVAEISAADVRFEDLFTSHAASYPPPRVFSVGADRKLHDVTRRFPKVTRANAAEARKLLRRKDLAPVGGSVVAGGAMSAYVADEYLLGRGTVGVRELDKQIKRGLLGTRKQARAYRKRLLRLLKLYGYR